MDMDLVVAGIVSGDAVLIDEAAIAAAGGVHLVIVFHSARAQVGPFGVGGHLLCYNHLLVGGLPELLLNAFITGALTAYIATFKVTTL